MEIKVKLTEKEVKDIIEVSNTYGVFKAENVEPSSNAMVVFTADVKDLISDKTIKVSSCATEWNINRFFNDNLSRMRRFIDGNYDGEDCSLLMQYVVYGKQVYELDERKDCISM